MCKFAVIDLEMCKVPKQLRTKQYRYATETIQIGAALLNENLEIVDQFVSYVSPEYGFIDGFIKKLTGITPEHVKDAPSFSEALKAFVEWLPEDTKVVSWSDTDAHQIKREMQFKGVEIPRMQEILDDWIDCQKTFTIKMNTKKIYNLKEALIAADIFYKDGAHDGYVDAYNTALLFVKLEKEPELILNSYYMRARSEEKSHLSTTLGDLFAGLDLSGCLCG